MKIIIFLSILFIPAFCSAQELFTYTEPASNMATKSIGLRATNILMQEQKSGTTNYYFNPEIMWGISKKLMVHTEAFINNYNDQISIVGGGLYMKYRFYSQDEVHSHFRMAATGRFAYNKNNIYKSNINLNGDNSGCEFGVIATKLIHKVAISAGSSFLYRFNGGSAEYIPKPGVHRKALAYNLSFGKLLLPKEYTDYKQVNVNGMIEVLGQTNLNYGSSSLDLAPSVQFIFLSKMRLDLGYRFPLINDLSLSRNFEYGFLLRFEYSIFNAFK